jgi:hypothetical protein
MAAISLFWYTNMAAVTSDENDLNEAFVGSKATHFGDLLRPNPDL